MDQQNATHYVVGFMFSKSMSPQVALIRKNKPAWQEGKLNGIGGKIEEGETAKQAMVREFMEETGVETFEHQWSQYHMMGGNTADGEGTFSVAFFVTSGDLDELCSMTDEEIEIIPLREINPILSDQVENLCWLVALAYDHLVDGRPNTSTSIYR